MALEVDEFVASSMVVKLYLVAAEGGCQDKLLSHVDFDKDQEPEYKKNLEN